MSVPHFGFVASALKSRSSTLSFVSCKWNDAGNAEMRFYAIDGHDAIDTLAIILHITVIIERIGHLLIAK